MSQHFLLSRQAKTITLAQVMRLSDAEAETMMRRIRWAPDGEPACSHCGSLDAYDCRRPSGAPRWRCRGCKKDFSITSGTLFSSYKLPLRGYLAAIAIFCNEVKGKSMLALSRDLGLSYKSAFVLSHKLREAMAEELKGRQIGDDRPEAEVDGAYFGTYVRPANLKEDRVDRHLRKNYSKNRKVVVVIRERGGETLPGVFKSESQALSWIKHRVVKGTVLHADEASSWNDLHARYEVKRIDHQQAYSLDGASTNQAESYFSRIRRGEMGHHHHISGPYLLRFAQEAAWREDNRRVPNGEQISPFDDLPPPLQVGKVPSNPWHDRRPGCIPMPASGKNPADDILGTYPGSGIPHDAYDQPSKLPLPEQLDAFRQTPGGDALRFRIGVQQP